MERKLVISTLLNQVQVGIVEDGRLVEYYLERDEHDRAPSRAPEITSGRGADAVAAQRLQRAAVAGGDAEPFQ